MDAREFSEQLMHVGLDHPSRARRLRFVAVTGVTGLNLMLGLVAVLLAASGMLEAAAWCLLLSAVCDGFDGPLARRWQVTSDFGAELDSLADMTSFIVGGGALAYFWLDVPETNFPIQAAMAVCGLYVLAGAIRLARFNVTIPTQQSYFQGMPTTIVASIVALNALIHPLMQTSRIIGLVLLLSVLMVSVFPYPKLSALMPRLPSWGYPLVLVGAAVNVAWTVGLVTSLYICSGPFISARRRIARPH